MIHYFNFAFAVHFLDLWHFFISEGNVWFSYSSRSMLPKTLQIWEISRSLHLLQSCKWKPFRMKLSQLVQLSNVNTCTCLPNFKEKFHPKSTEKFITKVGIFANHFCKSLRWHWQAPSTCIFRLGSLRPTWKPGLQQPRCTDLPIAPCKCHKFHIKTAE